MKFYLETNETDSRPVFITGNFDDWKPTDPDLELIKESDGVYSIEIDDKRLPDIIEYKYSKGGWEHVELDKYGNVLPNRKVAKSAGVTHDVVERWRFNWSPFKQEYFPIVELINERFYIPQLEKTRKVWALLPHDYYQTDKSYPVLYLQDAQNLFHEGSEFGNWEIDKKLSILSEYGRGDLIVIAVEHGGQDRMKEYVFQNPKLTKEAEGKKYIRFMADTLKPYVDSKYRTLRDRDNTGIGGSSLGALISIYAGFLYPEVYSKLMLFSPSLWVEPGNNFPLVNFQDAFRTKVYLYGGKKEGDSMVRRISDFEKAMGVWEKQGMFNFEICDSFDEEGKHQEFFWSREFPKAIEWLYFDSKQDPTQLMKKKRSPKVKHTKSSGKK